MLIKVIWPDGTITLQNVEEEPQVGDTLVYDGGKVVVTLSRVIVAVDDPNGAAYVCRGEPTRLLAGKNQYA